MNRHFAPTDFQHDGAYVRPARLYGSLDHLERGDQSTLAAFDCVDADWFDAQRYNPRFGGYFNGAHSQAADHFWRGFWKAIRSPGQNPLDDMPLFRIEVDLPALSRLTSSRYGLGAEDSDPDLAAAESAWLEFRVASDAGPSSFRARLYHGMFLPSNDVFISADELGEAADAKVILDLMMRSLSGLDEPDQRDLESALGAAEADYLGVWDVGQGNANALLDSGFCATAWFDVGCGVYRNAWTRPAALEFCWGRPGVGIVLSHWDADHWAGAQIATPAGTTPALGCNWIVPVQKVTAIHLSFASTVAANGRLWGLRARSAVVGIGARRQVRLELGKGSSRNHSGIVMLVENGGAGADAWLLTGDCDYRYMATTPATVLGLVAPHHGASLARGSTPPGPAGTYRRLAYSFGANNAHGAATSHPTAAGIDAHRMAGWAHGAWTPPAAPALSLAGGDVLATAQHTPGASRAHPPPAAARLEGALMGWVMPVRPWTHCSRCTAATCAPALRQT